MSDRDMSDIINTIIDECKKMDIEIEMQIHER